MPMSITVTKGKPGPVDVFHQVTDREIVLVIGEYRFSMDVRDPHDLMDGALVLDKLQAVVPAARRDVENAIAAHKRAEQERVRAAAALAPQESCACGEPDKPGTVHRMDLPCHARDVTPCFTCRGNGCTDCAGTGNQDVVNRTGTSMQPVRETTAARPYISAVTPMSTLTRAAGALDAQRPGCSSGEHGPCPAHGGSVPGEETRDLTGMMSRPLQAVPNLEAQR